MHYTVFSHLPVNHYNIIVDCKPYIDGIALISVVGNKGMSQFAKVYCRDIVLYMYIHVYKQDCVH